MNFLITYLKQDQWALVKYFSKDTTKQEQINNDKKIGTQNKYIKYNPWWGKVNYDQVITITV